MTSYIMEQHQKNEGGNGLILYYLSHTFRFPKDFPMLTYVSQILQAEAMRYGVEHWRRNRNGYRCMGTLYWQYNDCWPVASWSGIEYNHHWKALNYYAKRFFAPVLLSAEETECAVKLHITNDRQQPFDGLVRWSLEKLDGTVITSAEALVNVPAASDTCIAELDFSEVLDDEARRTSILVYELYHGDERMSMGTVSFAPSKHLKLSEVKITTDVKEVDGVIQLTLTSDKTARFVMLEVPVDCSDRRRLLEKEQSADGWRLAAGGCEVRFSDNFFDLPAGRSVTVDVGQSAGLSADEIARELRIVSLRDSY